MTIGNLIYHLSYPIKNLIRQLQRFHKKTINNKYFQVHNKTYIYLYAHKTRKYLFIYDVIMVINYLEKLKYG